MRGLRSRNQGMNQGVICDPPKILPQTRCGWAHECVLPKKTWKRATSPLCDLCGSVVVSTWSVEKNFRIYLCVKSTYAPLESEYGRIWQASFLQILETSFSCTPCDKCYATDLTSKYNRNRNCPAFICLTAGECNLHYPWWQPFYFETAGSQILSRSFIGSLKNRQASSLGGNGSKRVVKRQRQPDATLIWCEKTLSLLYRHCLCKRAFNYERAPLLFPPRNHDMFIPFPGSRNDH